MQTEFIKIHRDDNVAVAVKNLEPGKIVVVDNKHIELIEEIPAGHKFALQNFGERENIIKYGYAIGHARSSIQCGALVNEKNIKTNLSGILEYQYNPALEYPDTPKHNLTFRGYRRSNGSTGIRNEIWIIPTVGCVNGTVNQLVEAIKKETNEAGIDAVAGFTHNFGCSQLGDDHENTRKILRDIVLHPNTGGVLIVGLGCENNQVDSFSEMLGEFDTDRVKFMETQKVSDEFETGMELLRGIYALAKEDKRVDVPLSELKVGLKCGGSDGFSGITANPLLGAFSDFLTSQGGSTVLTEVPEMFGAETILMNRCGSEDLFQRTVHLINNFKEYFIKNNQPVYENPSPGNKAGGISTLEEKSLGCTQKCGKSVVKDVLMYGDMIKNNGLSLLSAPGNDLVAATALGAAGCQLVLFTTGRGTPFGSFVPTMKISTNSSLFLNKPKWIDFNAGVILENQTIDQTNEAFIAYIIEVASGRMVNNEKNNYREISIWKSGVTM